MRHTHSPLFPGTPVVPAGDELFTGPPIAGNATALAVAGDGPGTIWISSRRAVNGWSTLSMEERGDVLGLLDALGAAAGTVDFALAAPAGERWRLRLRRAPEIFTGLPAFLGGQEQELFPALQAALAGCAEADILVAFVKRFWRVPDTRRPRGCPASRRTYPRTHRRLPRDQPIPRRCGSCAGSRPRSTGSPSPSTAATTATAFTPRRLSSGPVMRASRMWVAAISVARR